MSLRIALRIALLIALGAFIYWIATHTYWAEGVVPGRPGGAALSDPFYAAERLTRALGAHPSAEKVWKLPSTSAVIVTAFWDWDRSSAQRAELQHWVESGGRLVAGSSYNSSAFSDWSGITRRTVERKARGGIRAVSGGCRHEEESGAGPWPAAAAPRRYEICNLYGVSFLTSKSAPVWQVADAYGVQALRIKVGRGSVSVVNGVPFTYLGLLKGSNASLFVAATQLHAGDHVYFVSDQGHASLLALTWRFGAPVVVLLLGALILALWRAAPRFGPSIPSPEKARRSLAEQIRGTGQFLLSVGDGQALHAATVRALFAAAPRRISAFSNLPSAERIARLARATGFSDGALAAAINYTGARRATELRSAIALLEAARREILRNNDRSTDGN
ncbi:MAG TPA: hypothetical protein VFX20_19610 [Steroidobacteraceae bacterium]|nr:hypothetical protein [Steroidobacteraceae bacterium]